MAFRFSISLPIKDRKTAHDFYRHALDLETVGELADDGIPEPLQFSLDARTTLYLIPADGLQGVIGSGRLVSDGSSECLLSLEVPGETDVQRMFQRCVDAGAAVISEPSQKDWGYDAMIADPDGHLWQIAVASEADA